MIKNSFQNNRKRRSSLKIYFFAGVFFCLLAGLIYIAIWLQHFWIKNINIENDMIHVSSLEIGKDVQVKIDGMFWKFIPKKSIFLTSIDQIKNEILDKYSEIKTIEIKKKFPDTLNIKIEKRKNIGVWCQIEPDETATSTERIIERKINECFYFDSDGIIFREASLIKGGLVLNVYGIKKPINLRDEIMSLELVEFILFTRQELPEIIDFEIVSFENLIATTNKGYQIYFNPTYSARSQLEALRMVIKKEIKQELDSLEYIDLKIEGRVYYK